MLAAQAQEPGGATSDNRTRFDVSSHDGTGGDERAFSDGDSGENDSSATDGSPSTDARGNQFPVEVGLEFAVLVGGVRIAVVGEDDPVTDEDSVFDGDSGADEGVAGDFAAGTDVCSGLDLDECPDSGLVPDQASVEVSEAVDDHVPPQLNRWRHPNEIRWVEPLVSHCRHV